MKKLIINEKYDRKVLDEGRNFGIGFSILKKNTKYKYDTLLPFSACKDYMNDIVYKTFYNKEIEFKCHGYTAVEMKCYNRKHKYFYLGVNTLDYKGNMNWNKLEQARQILVSNIENLVIFLNKLEDYLNLDIRRITLNVKNNNEIVLKCPSFWMHKTYFISLLALVIRLFFNIEKKDLNKSIKEIAQTHVPFIEKDQYNSKNIIKFLELNLKGKDLLKDFPKSNLTVNEKSTIHNAGIVSFTKQINNKKYNYVIN